MNNSPTRSRLGRCHIEVACRATANSQQQSWLLRQAFATCCLLALCATQADAAAMRAGFNTNNFAANDDNTVMPGVNLGFSIDFFGTNYSTVYINNNGNVTFDAPLSTFTPFDLTTTMRTIIAPFFADVDTRGGTPGGSPGITQYGSGTVGSHSAFGVTWRDVEHFSVGSALNSFQLVLIDRSDIATGAFDIEFNYDQILWETGQASGGGTAGIGPDSARIGYSNGKGKSFELAGSGISGAFLDSNTTTGLIHNRLNSTVDGRYVLSNYEIASFGSFATAPEPSSLVLLGIGALGLFSVSRRQKRTSVGNAQAAQRR